MSRVNIALDDLDAGYMSGSCSGDESVEIEIGNPEPASTRSLSSAVVEDVELTVGVNPSAPTRSADAAGAGAATAAKARQLSIARLFTSKQAPTPQQQRAKEKRAEQRQRDDDVDAALANLTAPARAAHIDKTRVMRSHAKVRAARRRAAEEEEEEEENGSASAGKKREVSPGGDTNPPPRVGLGAVDEVYLKVGFANDVVFLRGSDGRLAVSDFHVMFNRRERAKGGSPGSTPTLSTKDKSVHTYVNGELQPQLYLRVQDDGLCTFPDGRLHPPPEALAGGIGLVDGINTLRFEMRFHGDPRVLVAQCLAFLWAPTATILVVDIDGTITRSDVRGLLMTLSPGLVADHTHAGICELLCRMTDEEEAHIVYLTSRPIALATKTRTFLTAVEQNGKMLPLGPLLCCLENVKGVLWRELFVKDMHDYKTEALRDLARPFREAGRPVEQTLYAAGIGNKVHDAVAYRAAGVPQDFIFIIDTNSNLRAWDGNASKYGESAGGEMIAAEPTSPSVVQKTLHQNFESGRISTPHVSDGARGSSGQAERWDEEVVLSTIDATPRDSQMFTGKGARHIPPERVISRRELEVEGDREPAASADTTTTVAITTTATTIVNAPSEPPADSAPHSQALPTITTIVKASCETPADSTPQPQALPTTTVSLQETVLQENVNANAKEGTSSSSTKPALTIEYQSYGDERFFSRLRASVDPAAWEALKAEQRSAEREARSVAIEGATQREGSSRSPGGGKRTKAKTVAKGAASAVAMAVSRAAARRTEEKSQAAARCAEEKSQAAANASSLRDIQEK